jgi:diguanylate cyclase (GGDEF)-like protein
VSDSAADKAALAALAAALHETILTGQAAPVPQAVGVEEFAALLNQLADLSSFTLALSQGDLDHSLAQRGMMAGALKALQAALRHLNWQTQRVAAGDFSQRVEFMGEFSQAFNSMVVALDESRSELDLRNQELRELAEKYEWLSITDSLTGAYNRRKLNELVAHEIARARRYSHPLSLFILDIDYFKRVNDTYGHDVGDAVLVELAGVVRDCMRDVDSLARWGGEEFVVLTPAAHGLGSAALAERTRAAVAAHVFPAAGHVYASFGVAEFAAGDTADTLFARADVALYKAKDGGRNRVELAQ